MGNSLFELPIDVGFIVSFLKITFFIRYSSINRLEIFGLIIKKNCLLFPCFIRSSYQWINIQWCSNNGNVYLLLLLQTTKNVVVLSLFIIISWVKKRPLLIVCIVSMTSWKYHIIQSFYCVCICMYVSSCEQKWGRWLNSTNFETEFVVSCRYNLMLQA